MEDLCDRVDLRQVNKRAMECLIKAGALDRFGKRSQLLAVLDSMVANSAETHAARENGQLSLFGAVGEAEGIEIMPIRLPDLEEVKGREKLQWEKELLGVYTVSHPLQNLGIDLKKVVTCACNELDESHDGKSVLLAGMITNIRTINTKKGDPMAFVQIEDFQGQCEVVVFPRTYLEVKDKLVLDSVLIFKGKAQSREGQTSLLLDSVQTYVDMPTAIGDDSLKYQTPLLDVAPTINGLAMRETDELYGSGSEDGEWSQAGEESPFRQEMPAWLQDDGEVDDNAILGDLPPVYQNGNHSTLVTAATPATLGPATKSEPPLPASVPPVVTPMATTVPAQAPENGHHGSAKNGIAQNGAVKNGTVKAVDASQAPPDSAVSEPRASGVSAIRTPTSNKPTIEPPVANDSALPDASQQQPLASNGNHSSNGHPNGVIASPQDRQPETAAPTNPPDEPLHRSVASNLPHATPPNKSTKQRPGARRMHITFRRSGDLERDKFRLKEIYDRVRDSRGRDHFYIILEANGKRYELGFPNDACTISDRLVQELTKHFRVEVKVGEKPDVEWADEKS
ncbi:MAG: OB-fold nucleic acid binding domain-containing protein [Chloroflexi bacterium]|nr:OB-fold nucleic acid binding domain-containing protein [Chloroflexota bacterium]